MTEHKEISQDNGDPQRMKKIAIAISLIAVITAFLVFAPLKQWVVDILNWAQNLGAAAPGIVFLFYVVAAVAFLPGSVLTLGAGFLFGVPVGFVTAWSGATIGACAAFLIGRNLARDWVARKISANPRFMAMDEAIAREGFKLVFLLRLSPAFPYNFMNYALGLTRVTFRNFALASALGMIPGALMYVYLGSAARSLAEVASGKVESGLAGQVFFWLGLAATVAVALFATRIATRSIREVQNKQGDHPQEELGHAMPKPGGK